MSSSNDVDFKALYQNSLKLTSTIDDYGIPPLQKGLEQLDQASQARLLNDQKQRHPLRGATASLPTSPPSSSSSSGLWHVDRKKRPASRSGMTPASASAAVSSNKRAWTSSSSTAKASTLSKAASMDKANFLLATRGIDAEKLSKDLARFQVNACLDTTDTLIAETDLDGFLNHHHELILVNAMEESSRQTMEATHDRMNQSMIDEFDSVKQKFLEEMGATKQLGVTNYPRVQQFGSSDKMGLWSATKAQASGNGRAESSLADSFAGLFRATKDFSKPSNSSSASALFNATSDAPLRMSHLEIESAMTQEMKQYANVIQELNAQRIPNTRNQFNLLGAFRRLASDEANAAATVANSKWENIAKCWQLVETMLVYGNKGKTLLEERQFDEDSRTTLAWRFAFGARVFLENQYRTFLEQTVEKQRLATGGIPDLMSSVRAFVRFMNTSKYAALASNFASSTSSNDRSSSSQRDSSSDFWALLYYCLRCGGDEEAIDLATSCIRAGGNNSVDTTVVSALRYRAHQKKAYRDGQLEGMSSFSRQFPNEYERLLARYQRLTSAGSDALAVVNGYERCVLNLLCFGNPNASEPRILTTIEDYLWQRLCFIQPASGNLGAPDSVYSITRLAKSIQRFGPAHFEQSASQSGGAHGAAFLYFEILLVVQQFEQAVKYLMTKGFLEEAIHFAIALNHYGLLKTVSSISLLGGTAMEPEEEDDQSIDFVRMVRQYVHGFQRTNPCEAAEYLACINDLAFKKELFAELLLDTRQMDVLAGFTNNTDGSRTRGVFDRLLKDQSEDEIKEIVLNAARKAEERGLFHEAFQLLKAAGDIESAIGLLNVQLGATLSGTRVERDEWFRVACDFAEKWMRFPWAQQIMNRVARPAATAFQTLLNISMFLELLEKQNYDAALRLVDEGQLLPVVDHVTADRATQLGTCVDRFMSFDENVHRNFHLVLIGYMECLVRASEHIKAQAQAQVQTQMPRSTSGSGIDDDRRQQLAELREKAELIVTFAGMIKFRLPSGTNERLNRLEGMIY